VQRSFSRAIGVRKGFHGLALPDRSLHIKSAIESGTSEAKTMNQRVRVGLWAATVMALGATDARSQIRGSELGGVMQVIDGTRITMEYSRPLARGRALFGQTVP
jgi:hypothetical protein